MYSFCNRKKGKFSHTSNPASYPETRKAGRSPKGLCPPSHRLPKIAPGRPSFFTFDYSALSSLYRVTSFCKYA